MNVLVTGGAGFIGSHTCVDLLAHDHDIVVVDDFSNSSPRVLDEVARLSGRTFAHYELDVCDGPALDGVFSNHTIDAVIHFAARKAPRESVELPVEYYTTNLLATLNLLRCMQERGVSSMVFSSSCSIYGNAEVVPIDESTPPGPTNPYARTKLMCEEILADACVRHADWSVLALRYFNPTGAHESGDLGEDPQGVPNNVMPYIAQVAVGRLARLEVFGGDYPTQDGSGVRDYVHVMDLADAHRVALEQLGQRRGYANVNIGTGVGTSVLELVSTFEKVSGVEIPHRIVERRAGDVAELVASPGLAEAELGWTSQRDVEAMCRDAWAFQSRHPQGIT
ncbi:MAG TPA: UDP-glucose 4-epimerase GalE [Acidimicrobiales bacterium]|jgi:UDP-glucose 4-epimerase|nr:UDP-glucose 4-epimerase GalE [Acidimicrobiales bacterium]